MSARENMVRHKTYSRSRLGFTLIELLVITAIIAILAAILMPVYKQVHDKMRQITCLTNVKQIGTAMVMYAEDYDEALVPYQIYDATGPLLNPYADNIEVSNEAKKAIFMNQLLQPYMKGFAVWRCAARLNSWVNVEVSDPVYQVARSYGGQNSYAANLYAFRAVYNTYAGTFMDGEPLTLSSITSPTDTLAVVEGVGYLALPKEPCHLAGQRYDPIQQQETRFWMNIGDGIGLAPPTPNEEKTSLANGVKRHSGHVNCVFFDSHVKAMKYERAVLDTPRETYDSLWDPFKQGCN